MAGAGVAAFPCTSPGAGSPALHAVPCMGVNRQYIKLHHLRHQDQDVDTSTRCHLRKSVVSLPGHHELHSIQQRWVQSHWWLLCLAASRSSCSHSATIRATTTCMSRGCLTFDDPQEGCKPELSILDARILAHHELK